MSSYEDDPDAPYDADDQFDDLGGELSDGDFAELEDDFSDEDLLAQEDWEQEDATAPAQNEAAAGKKKTPLFNVIVIGLAVLLGLFMLVRQFGGAPAPVADTMGEIAVNEAQPAPESAPAEPEQNYGGFMNDSNTFGAINNQQSARAPANTYGQAQPVTEPPMPAPFTQSAEQVPSAPQDAGVLTPMPEDPFQQPTPVAAAPTPTPVETPAPPPVQEQPALLDNNAGTQAGGLVGDPFSAPEAVEAQQPAPEAPAAVSPDVAAKLDQLLSRMDAIDSRLETLEGNVQQVSVLRDAVDALEKRVSEEKVAPAKKAAKASSEDTPRPAPKRAASPVPSAYDDAYVPSAPPSPPKAAVPAAQANDWVLKSAQNGRAYVARRGQDDILSVSVGDTLPGVGRITGVGQQNGRWVVTGTQGQVSQ